MALAGIMGQGSVRPATTGQPRAPTADFVTLDIATAPAKASLDDANAMDKALSPMVDRREKFIPIARFALVDRLIQPGAWVADHPADARRLFQFIGLWRKQRYTEHTLRLQQSYEPFSPDTDLLVTRTYSSQERAAMQKRVIAEMAALMEGADFETVDVKQALSAMGQQTHYGLDLEVDLTMFEELALYYSGNITRKELRRTPRKLFLRREEFVLPVFQRLCIVFKVRSEDAHVVALMARDQSDEKAARKLAKKERALLPPSVKPDFIYMKLFKDIPKSDIEMIFPNTKIKFRLKDKLRLGVTTSSGIGMGLMATIGKVAVAVGVFAWFGALIGLSLIVFRQIMNFVNTKNKYLQTMARNLYSHALADNAGVIELIAGRAAEQDTKEDILLYSVLVKEAVHRDHLSDVDKGVESFLETTFRISADFETDEALERLKADGLVTESADGILRALSPVDAATQVDKLWDQHLDHLVADGPLEGQEIQGIEPTAALGDKMAPAPLEFI